MSQNAKSSSYAEKLKSLLDRNKQIAKDLESGKLTTQEASDRVNSLSMEIKKLTSHHERGT